MPIPLPTFSHRSIWRASLIGLVGLGLVLAACTRSANPSSALPTATTGAGDATAHVPSGLSEEEATFAAVGTQVAGSLTATAAALMGSGAGGEAVTPGVPLPTTDPGLLPTAVPGSLPTVPPAVVATATPIPQPAATTAPAVACPNPYTVQQGEWIYAIARKCGLSAQAIIAANPGIDPHRLSPGQVINLPAPGTVPGVPAATAAPAAGCTGTYTVITGDTLWRIATRCGFTVEQLAALNGIPYPYSSINVGQVLRFP
jgi:LysM repeat protein